MAVLLGSLQMGQDMLVQWLHHFIWQPVPFAQGPCSFLQNTFKVRRALGAESVCVREREGVIGGPRVGGGGGGARGGGCDNACEILHDRCYSTSRGAPSLPPAWARLAPVIVLVLKTEQWCNCDS